MVNLKAELKRIQAKYLPHAHWGIMLMAAFLRIWGIWYPPVLVFDETYYVKDAWTLTHLGYEAKWPDSPDKAFAAGHVNSYLTDGSFVVHPPLGKWLIGLGMNIFGGANSWGWRIVVALFGLALVWLVILVARRLLGDRNWANIAGLLIAIDGHAITMSRFALLDGMLTTFIVLAFYLLLRDREDARVKYTLRLGQPKAPVIWNRPWLVATAIVLGLATSVKWSGLYFAFAFGLYIVISETLLRRRYGFKDWFASGIAGQGVATLVLMVPAYALTYLASWSGWLATSGGYDRNSDTNPLIALWNYHRDAYNFHVNLHAPHSYQSNPLSWLYLGRPVSFYYASQTQAECGWPNGCSSAITAIGDPLIWWGALAALLYLTFHYFRYRNRTEGLILLGVAAGYLPWMLYTQRTVFSFYAIVILPFTVIALVYVLRSLWNRPRGTEFPWRFWVRAYLWAAGALAAFYLNLSWGFWTPYYYWMGHMWFPAWI